MEQDQGQDQWQVIDPKKDRVLVRLAAAVTTFAGGMLVGPQETHERPAEGLVLAKGKGRIIDNGELIPVEVQVGDRVLFGRHAGTLLDLQTINMLGYSENDQYKIMREDEVIAVVRNATAEDIEAYAEFEKEHPPTPVSDTRPERQEDQDEDYEREDD